MNQATAVDWQRPWLAPFLPAAAGLTGLAPDLLAQLNAAAARLALTNARGLPLQFVAQENLPPGEAYEAYIDRTGTVPTRDNLHDYFNALAWLTYPAAKRILNAIQARELARRAPACVPSATRGKLRDRATIFDENAAVLLCADPAFEQALRAHDWQTCFVTPHAKQAVYEVRLFGHALLEKLVMPYKAITAHVWVLAVEPSFLGQSVLQKTAGVDRLLSEALERGLLAGPPTPLPVLGVPGWWQPQDAAFYADDTVFRKKRAG